MYGIGVDRDRSEAFRLISRYVEDHKDWFAYFHLTKLYEERAGVLANFDKMAELCKRDTELLAWQLPYYQGYYGLCLIRGIGVPVDKKSGWDMIRRSGNVETF